MIDREKLHRIFRLASEVWERPNFHPKQECWPLAYRDDSGQRQVYCDPITAAMVGSLGVDKVLPAPPKLSVSTRDIDDLATQHFEVTYAELSAIKSAWGGYWTHESILAQVPKETRQMINIETARFWLRTTEKNIIILL